MSRFQEYDNTVPAADFEIDGEFGLDEFPFDPTFTQADAETPWDMNLLVLPLDLRIASSPSTSSSAVTTVAIAEPLSVGVRKRHAAQIR